MNTRVSHLPVIVLTGASGFVGRYFIEAYQDDYYIYALARRSQKAADIPFHKNIHWLRVDISHEKEIKRILNEIARNGGADFFLHFAGFFDFHRQYDPEYQKTNVDGTRYILEAVADLHLKRFIFTSSLAVFDVFKSDEIYNELSTPNATFPYAWSKREGEKIIKKHSSYFPCTVLRLAAIFSDWCEHRPLYSMLCTWLSNRWDQRFLAGKGKTAIPYLHINDLLRLLCCVIKQTDELPRCHILHATPGKCTSHKELFQLAYAYNFFHSAKPVFIPKWIATCAIALRNIIGWPLNKQPFERLWMMKYIDHELNVDSAYTRNFMKWGLIERNTINRRIPFMISKMKSNPFEWHYRNKMRPSFAETERPYLKIYEEMLRLQDKAVQETLRQLRAKQNTHKFPGYQKLKIEKLIHRIEYIYKMLEIDVCTGDRSHILNYAHNLAKERYLENFSSEEVMSAVKVTADVIIRILLEQEHLKGMKQRIYDEIMLTLQMAMDEIEDTYEYLETHPQALKKV